MYGGERKVFTPPQVMAMLLQKIKEIGEKGTEAKKVSDVVISVRSTSHLQKYILTYIFRFQDFGLIVNEEH